MDDEAGAALGVETVGGVVPALDWQQIRSPDRSKVAPRIAHRPTPAIYTSRWILAPAISGRGVDGVRDYLPNALPRLVAQEFKALRTFSPSDDALRDAGDYSGKVSNKVSNDAVYNALQHMTTTYGPNWVRGHNIMCSRRESNPEPWD